MSGNLQAWNQAFTVSPGEVKYVTVEGLETVESGLPTATEAADAPQQLLLTRQRCPACTVESDCEQPMFFPFLYEDVGPVTMNIGRTTIKVSIPGVYRMADINNAITKGDGCTSCAVDSGVMLCIVSDKACCP